MPDLTTIGVIVLAAKDIVLGVTKYLSEESRARRQAKRARKRFEKAQRRRKNERMADSIQARGDAIGRQLERDIERMNEDPILGKQGEAKRKAAEAAGRAKPTILRGGHEE